MNFVPCLPYLRVKHVLEASHDARTHMLCRGGSLLAYIGGLCGSMAGMWETLLW